MHIVNSCAYDIQHTENNKQCRNENYHLNRLLSASAWPFLSFLIIIQKTQPLALLLMCCSSYLHGKQFPSIHNKTTYFHMHIYISEFVIPLCCRYQVVLS